MRQPRIISSALLACLAALAAFGSGRLPFEILDPWLDPDLERKEFHKVMVVGITDDRDVRHHFEEKFVSHLRGRGHECVTGYSLVPDLTVRGDRQRILDAIEEQSIDAAITVRLVSLEVQTESEWGQSWRDGYQSEWSLKRLVDETLPTTGQKHKRVGIEVVLWDARTGDRVWAGRSSGLRVKKLKRQGAGDFVQMVIRALEDDRLL